MKKSILILAIVSIATNLFAQDKKACKADILAEKTGTVIEKEYQDISKMNHLTIVVENVTDLTRNQKLSGLDFEYTLQDNTGSVSTILDPDEVDGLIAFMQNLQDNISKAAGPKNYTEYTYQTLSGFEAGCYWDKEDKKWKTYIKVDASDSKTNMELNKDDFAVFMSNLKQAKAKF